MKRSALFVLFVLLPLGAFAQNAGRYIVVTRQPAREALGALRNDSWEPHAATAVREFRYINAFAADLTDQDLATLKASPNVRWVEPVVERHMLADSVTAGQQTTPYGVSMVHAPDVWPVTKGKAVDGRTAINIAEIDTGIRFTDPELKNAYKGGHNFIDGSSNPFDDNGHGTHVAGILAAADDGAGVVGVAPEVSLYALKVLDQCGSGSTEDVMAAVEWVITQKAATGGDWIMSLSLGSDTPSDAEKAEFQKAADNGILTFAAAGNNYDPTNPVDGLSYPAGYPSVVSVGAIDSTETVASFSQRGTDLKVVAPGVSVLSTFVSEDVATNAGDTYGVMEMDAQKSNGDSWCFTRPNITSTYVFCGIGNPSDFPSSVSGKIALIQRGTLTFAQKAKNAKAAGAIAVIVYNNVPGAFAGTLGTLTSASDVPYTVSMSDVDGAALKANPNATVTFSFGLEGYALLDGTSMATPHASAVAALAWAVAPNASATSVANAIESTATDLGTAGFDTTYGNGLVNALAAAKQLNPSAFGSPVQPPPVPVTGRIPGRRGH
jgi:serine protease